MNIEDKLKLSKQTNSIYFFREGIFAQLFNVSLYLGITQLGLGIKICSQSYKKLNNRLVLRAGLPTSALERRYPDLIKHDFGYELKGDWPFNRTDYDSWCQYNLNLQLNEQAEKTAKQQSAITQNSIPLTNPTAPVLLPQGTKSVQLTEQEYHFLQLWQQDKFPASIESGFIRGLVLKIKADP